MLCSVYCFSATGSQGLTAVIRKQAVSGCECFYIGEEQEVKDCMDKVDVPYTWILFSLHPISPTIRFIQISIVCGD
jgi:hypothetical protein